MRTKITALTGIRAIGAILIAIYHFQSVFYEAFPITNDFSWIMKNLFLAVPMFFILSGIVIELNYGNTKINFIQFMYNRLSRLLPISIVSQAIAFLVMYIQVNHFNNFGVEIPDFYNFVNWIKNVVLLWAINMPYKQYQWNQPAWSASAELILYLIFPAFILFRFLLKKINKLRDCLIISFGLSYVAHNITTDFVYYGWLSSAILYFTIGVVLCRALMIYIDKRNETYKQIMSVLQIICPIILILLFLLEIKACVSIIITCFIFSLFEEEGIISKVLSLNFFQKIGKMSYTIYMIHWCIFGFSALLRIEYPSLIDTSLKYKLYVVITWLVLFLVSYFLYHYVEEPCSKLMKKMYNKRCK